MKILILGGTKFVGKDIAVELISTREHVIDFLNRNRSNPNLFHNHKKIIFDRDNPSGYPMEDKQSYDLVVDVSCYNLNQLLNVLNIINFDKYIFISSSAVEAIPFNNVSPDMYDMASYALNKKICEDYIIKNFKKYLIYRPCYLVGEADYTNRFYEKNGRYFWNDGNELTYYIHSKDLANLIADNLQFENNMIINPCKQ